MIAHKERQRGISVPVLLLVTVIVIAAAVLILPRALGRYLLTPDLIEARIVAPLEEVSGRHVDIDELELGIGGLRVYGLVVGEEPGLATTGPFLSAERLELRLDWLALVFRRQLSAAGLIADGLSVRLRRRPDGGLALAGLAGRLRAGDGQDRSAAWSLSRLSVRSGTIELEGSGGTVKGALAGLQLEARGILGSGRRDLSIQASAERGQWGRLLADNAELSGRLAGHALSVNKAEASLAGGRLSLDASLLSAERQRLSATVHADSIDLTALAEMLTGNKRLSIEGDLSGSLVLASEGRQPAELVDGLSGQGQVHIGRGLISGSKGLRSLATAVGFDRLATLELEDSGGDFKIAGRRVSSERMLAGNKDARLIMKGSVGFDSTLDLQAWVGVGPGRERSWLSVGTLLPYMRDKEGWTNIAVAIKGSLKQPRVSVPPRALAEHMMQLVPDAAELIIREGSDATGNILKEGLGLPGAILREGAEGIGSVLDELERVLEGGD